MLQSRESRRGWAKATVEEAPQRLRAHGSQSDQAYAALEQAIVLGELEPNALLLEAELMKATGFGRSPLREAIQRLAKDQLVTIVPYRGAFVVPMDPLIELTLLEMRRELDPVLVGAAAELASAEQRAELLQLADETRRLLANDDRVAAVKIDAIVKSILLEICGNPYLSMTMRPIYALSRRFYFNTARRPDSTFNARYHALIENVAGNRPSEAQAAALAFIDSLEKLARETLMKGTTR
jgi:DNA-binding GntR family transcriptional regulator